MENGRSVRAVTVFRLQEDKIWHLGGKAGSRDLQFWVENKLSGTLIQVSLLNYRCDGVHQGGCEITSRVFQLTAGCTCQKRHKSSYRLLKLR